MTPRTQARLLLAVWIALGALLIGPILFAPVMREPSRTISATDYFGND